ncbi:MYCBP-associated protein [Callorhinchus milii]|uniref:MYCBP-associated protein n=1 Tax=Callorhinchus milii TaxID=7868 RepID=UPI001C3F6A48|nr:MYCBP-associated protein [Callorhinchus milii]
MQKDPGQKTPPEKKRLKGIEEFMPIEEDPGKDSVLKGDDIMALAIKKVDLEKLHYPKLTRTKSFVKSTLVIRKPRPNEDKVKKLVAKPTLVEEIIKSVDYSGPGGPRFDAQGRILPHSILGRLEDFRRELLRRGNEELASLIPTSLQTEPKPPVLSNYKKKARLHAGYKAHHQESALENWQQHMADRKKQQAKLARLLQKPSTQLLINQSEDLGQMKLNYHLIDLSIALQGHGKGYHVGSEFWHQPPLIGDELSGLMLTLNQTERGYPPPLIHVGKSLAIKQEEGSNFPKGGKSVAKSKSESLYLKQRLDNVKSVLKEMDLREPEMDHLDVIGRGFPLSSVEVQQLPIEEEYNEAIEKENIDPLKDFPDVVEEPIIGPSIRFCGQPVRWLGGKGSRKVKQLITNTESQDNETCSAFHKVVEHSSVLDTCENEVGMVVRLTFEAMAGEKATSYMEILNDGTTAIFYRWKHLPQHCCFKKVSNDYWVQRFYFNTNGGVILPGENIIFTLIFKSENPGIFNDLWEFSTHPVLLGGAPLRVGLWGVALYEDKTESLRRRLQEELERKEKMTIVNYLINDVISGVRTPDRSRSPIEAYYTEEEIFHRKNPKLFYNHPVVESIKQLWDQCFVKREEEEKGGPDTTIPPTTVAASSQELRPSSEPKSTQNVSSIDDMTVQDKHSAEFSDDNAVQTSSSTDLKADFDRKSSMEIKVDSDSELKHMSDARSSSEMKQGSDTKSSSDPKHSSETKSSAELKSASDTEPKSFTDNKSSEEVKYFMELEPSAEVKPEENFVSGTATPFEEPQPKWDLSIDSFYKEILSALDDVTQQEEALEKLNLKVFKLSTPSFQTQEDILYKVFYQLWVGTVDELVSCSLLHRERAGMPEKFGEGGFVFEETEVKKSGKTTKTVDRKTIIKEKDDKKKNTKLAGREEEKEVFYKRPTSRKGKHREDKRMTSGSMSQESDRSLGFKNSMDQQQLQHFQVDPAVQEKYKEKLYTESYALISGMLLDMYLLFEELKKRNQVPLDRCTRAAPTCD